MFLSTVPSVGLNVISWNGVNVDVRLGLKQKSAHLGD